MFKAFAKNQTIVIALFLALFFTPLLSVHAKPNSLTADQAFFSIADAYLDSFYFPTYPTSATYAGIHLYDHQLEDYSKKGLTHTIAELKKLALRIQAFPAESLSESVKADRELVLNSILSQRLTLETIRPWEKNPDYYSSGITTSAYVLIKRQFASHEDRLQALIAREKLMPAVLQFAKQNIKNPPKIYTEIALEQLPGLIHFFENDVPAAFATVSDKTLMKTFESTNASVINALKNYQVWLKESVLPHAHGDFRIGKNALQKKLKYDEMVELPLNQLIAIDMVDMHNNQKDFARIAKEIDPTKTPEQVLANLAKDHPAPDSILDTFHATFDDLIQFIKDKQIITIPSDVRPLLEETPPFLRAVTFASMDTPGPYEKKATEAYFNVTLPNTSWSSQRIDEFLAQFSFPSISSISIHETYPGHYVQFLWMHNIKDRVRKLIGASSNAEGWAHYCEQMMLDEGFGKTKSSLEEKKLKLAQLVEALLRNARFIVGIKMHTGQMTFDEAVDFFVKEGYQTKTVGIVEAKRGTSDPTYLYYTLGKLQILKLRADLQKKEGESFNLKKFHDNFMQQGFPPIKIVRKALLHDDSPTL